MSTVLWLSHGISSKSLSTTTRAQSLEKASTSLVDADIVVQGHSHELSVDNPRTVERLAKDYRKVHMQFQYLIQSGNFLLSRWYDPTGWGPYNEKKGLPARKPPGWAVAEISFPPGSREKQPIIQCSAIRFGIEAGEGGNRRLIDTLPATRSTVPRYPSVSLYSARLIRNPGRKVRRYYEEIGGASPIGRLTELQRAAFETALRNEGRNFRVYVGMRYWHPSPDRRSWK